MKASLFIIAAILLSIATGCRKDGSVSDAITEVDEALRNVSIAQELALIKADSIATLAEKTPDDSLHVRLLLEAADAYASIDLKNSLIYMKEALDVVSNGRTDLTDSIKVMLRIASLYNSEGLMTKEASDIFRHIPREKLPVSLYLDYYILGVQINKALADRSFDPSLSELYSRRAAAFRDSVLAIQPHSTIIAANRLVEKGLYQEALALMKSSDNTSSSTLRKGPYYHYIAGLYELLELPDSQRFYLAKAAADDLRHGVREYKALPELAKTISSQDIDRSYAYIQQSYNDAEASHASSRLREIAPAFNAISSSYREKQKEIHSRIIFIASMLGVLFIVIAFSFHIVRKKNIQLQKQSDQLLSTNFRLDMAISQLANTNRDLEEESRVKESFIRAFMQLCLSYLSKMESFRAKLGKIAIEGNLKKVTEAINSSRYVNKEIAEFYESFDRAFITLYPNFVSILNHLLLPEQRYPADTRLTTELRVYALIWLGIDSSGEIAKFLRCSESTVYNYRTIMRNRAINRQDFEKNFKSARLNNI